jgi:hypothetical protein
VEAPAGVCKEAEADDEEGELPQAVKALATPKSNSNTTSLCSRGLNRRLRPATAAANKPGIQTTAANAITREFLNRSSKGVDRLAVVLVWMVIVTLAVLLLPVNATDDG